MSSAILRFVGGMLLFAVAAELLCRLLPVSTATEVGYHHDATFMTYPSHHRWQVATGWDLRRPQKLAANNVGFAARRDFDVDPNAVALIGDSFVEGSAVESQQRLGSQLERALGGSRHVFEMGLPGTSLLDYAERIRFSHERFAVRDFVLFVELGDIPQSVCAEAPRGGVCLDLRSRQVRVDRVPEPSIMKRVFRHSALAQYLFSQLKLDFSRLGRQAFEQAGIGFPAQERLESAPRSGYEPEPDRQIADAVIDAFVARVQPYQPLRVVLLVDGARRADRPWSPRAATMRARLLERAAMMGMTAIDLEPVYEQHYGRSTQSLDIAPDDGHFNQLGLRLVAQQAERAIAGTAHAE